MKSVRATMRSAITEALANHGAFWSQVGAMVVNDLVWITFWLLFFHRVGSLRGWDRSGILMLLAVLTTGGGLVLGLLSNTRRLGQLIGDGGLDAILALPVHPLPTLLVRRVDPTNIGDVAFGLCLFAITGHPSLGRLAVFATVTVLGAVVFASFLILAGSLAFFSRGTESGDFGFNAMLMLASYPVDVFGGTAKVLVYTVIPAAFVATVPARVVTGAHAGDLVMLAVAAFAFALAAWATFTLGLRRYAGNSLWTRA